jgi:hypothetical protein
MLKVFVFKRIKKPKSKILIVQTLTNVNEGLVYETGENSSL